MNQAQWASFIRQNAPRFRVDPRAALAVASAEGLAGGVGDQGTSYGPFQLHRGGALPSGRGRAWAESPAGILYALRQIGQVAGGMHGQQAVANIVRRFERPADPGGEIVRAMGAYGGSPGQGAANLIAGPTSQTRGGRGTRTVLGPQRYRTTSSQVFDPGQLAQGIFGVLAGGGTPDVANLVSGSYKTVTNRVPLPRGVRRIPANNVGPPPVAGAIPTNKGWFDPAKGKIIGTPGSGTHTLGNWESDRALDVALKVGSPVYAPFAGKVGSQFGSLGAPGSSRFAGLRLHIASPQNEWYGAHLSRFAPGIRPGVAVHPGQLIGYSGSASGVGHLHEALKYGDPYRLIH